MGLFFIVRRIKKMKYLAIFVLICVAFATAEFFDDEGSGDLSCQQEYRQCRKAAGSWKEKRQCRGEFYKCRKGEVKECFKECAEEFKECKSKDDASVLKCGIEQFACRTKCPFSG